MKKEIYDMLQDLSHCTFLPGSYDKRFVRNLNFLKPEEELTEKQEVNVKRLHHRYRRQIRK